RLLLFTSTAARADRAPACVSGNVVEIDRLADALHGPVSIEPGVAGGISRARELRDRHPPARRLARREAHERWQRLARQVRRAAIREAEVRNPELRRAQLHAPQ